MRFLLIALLAAAWIGSTIPAGADFKLCNRTSYIVYAATAAATKAELDVRGWTRIVPGDCAVPITEALTAPAYFIYARTSLAHAGPPRAWGGHVPICARDANFHERLKLPVRGCPGGEFYRMPFALLERHNRTAWKTTLTEPGLKSLKDARHAGANRLLQDLGYHIDGPGERARDLAFEDFHKRAKLPADATRAELFTALESAAARAVSPTGYTVCNTTDQPAWAAIGLPAPGGNVTQGWWQIPRGACSHVITAPLNRDFVYLLVQRKGKQPIVSGPVKLCVQDTQFILTGKPRCSEKGLTLAGFAVTNTKGRPGYLAIVGENGLVTPHQQNGAQPK